MERAFTLSQDVIKQMARELGGTFDNSAEFLLST